MDSFFKHAEINWLVVAHTEHIGYVVGDGTLVEPTASNPS